MSTFLNCLLVMVYKIQIHTKCNCNCGSLNASSSNLYILYKVACKKYLFLPCLLFLFLSFILLTSSPPSFYRSLCRKQRNKFHCKLSCTLILNRTATARGKGEQADIAATQARDDSEVARIIAKQFAPDFHQPGFLCFHS